MIGPTAGFSFEASGAASSFVEITSSAAEGDADIVTTEYSYGDTGAFVSAASHTYVASGTFTITQRVTDDNGLTATTTRLVNVDLSGFTPVLLNDDDRSDPEVVLSFDKLGMEVIDDGGFVGVRSNRAVTPNSGMFYFEGQRITNEQNDMYFGVARATLPLDDVPGAVLNDGGVGVDVAGQVRFNGVVDAEFDDDNEFYGMVVDYRGANPIVHVIVEGIVITTIPMPLVTQPLFIFVGGRRREVGEQAHINPGNDTQNFPFNYNPVSALNNASQAGNALTLGWGQTRALPANTRPTLSVSPPGPVTFGNSVTLNATANDVEDGVISTSIHWADRATTHAERDTNDGSSWTLTPRAIGIHPIEVSVTDTGGLTRTSVVDVTVTGTLPQFNPVRLVADSLSGSGIGLSGNGLSAKWNDFGKYGIRANQGMIGQFMYFEMHRLIGPANQGGGLVILEGDLDPYRPSNIPPSCSVNHSASIWRNLISEADYDVEATSYYGFAVDYRGRSPRVYVITHEVGPERDIVSHFMDLDDVTVPIYPMLYGNPTETGAPFDAEINFGATAFNYNPVTVLQGIGVNTSELIVGWGDANSP